MAQILSRSLYEKSENARIALRAKKILAGVRWHSVFSNNSLNRMVSSATPLS
jgi:hypothetical protein